jgi:hypothetical protein
MSAMGCVGHGVIWCGVPAVCFFASLTGYAIDLGIKIYKDRELKRKVLPLSEEISHLKDLFKIHGVFGRQHTQPRRIQMNNDGEYDSEVPKTVKMKDSERTYLLKK